MGAAAATVVFPALVLMQTDNPWLAALAFVSAVLLAVGAAVEANRALRAVTGGPARFVVRDGVGFLVPMSPAYSHLVTGQVLLVGFLSGSAVDRWMNRRSGHQGSAVSDGLTLLQTVAVVVLGALVVLMVVAVLRGRPRVELTPHAVFVRQGLGSRTVPWDALRPGQPTQPGRVWAMTVDRPDLIVRRGLARRSAQVPVMFGDVHPVFFADVVRHYLAHPDHRAAIGQAAEHDRLLAALGA